MSLILLLDDDDDDDDIHVKTFVIVKADMILKATNSDGSKGISLYNSPYLMIIANNVDLINRFNQKDDDDDDDDTSLIVVVVVVVIMIG